MDVEFGPLTVVVGANASGKSNLVQIFRFLRDLVDSGIEDAVSLQGGAEFLRNVRASSEDPIEIELSSENRTTPYFANETAVLTKSTYSCAIDVRPPGVAPTILKEELILDFEWSDPDPGAQRADQIQITKGQSQYEKTTRRVALRFCRGWRSHWTFFSKFSRSPTRFHRTRFSRRRSPDCFPSRS